MFDIGAFINQTIGMLNKVGIMPAILIVGGNTYVVVLFVLLIYHFFRFIFRRFSQNRD